MCPTVPPAGHSVHVGECQLREPPVPSSASSYSQTSLPPSEKKTLHGKKKITNIKYSYPEEML